MDDVRVSSGTASRILGVSEATVRNWVRYGYLIPGNSTFSKADVVRLRERIESGEIDRLRKRANKKASTQFSAPDEYVRDGGLTEKLRSIQERIISGGLDPEGALFVLTLKSLVLCDEVLLKPGRCVYEISSYSAWKRQCVKQEMISWHSGLDVDFDARSRRYAGLFSGFSGISHIGTAGIIYQSLLSEGRRSSRGAYYTPERIIDGIFSDYNGKGGRFLDPCCGTGGFLLGAARSGRFPPCHITGCDIDPAAVKLSRIRLLLAFPDCEFTPRVYSADFLADTAHAPLFGRAGTFSLIATNPPWGAVSPMNKSGTLQQRIRTNETFSLFLLRSIETARRGGCVSFILPESILGIHRHSDIRKIMCKDTEISRISCLGRIFSSVFTPVIRIDMTVRKPRRDNRIVIQTEKGASYKVPQSRFASNNGSCFDIRVSGESEPIISKMYRKRHATLEGNAEWALGIVTGNNAKYVADKPAKGLEPVYRGSDVEKFRLKQPSSFIDFRPGLFQQAAPVWKYRASEKLVYKFISKRPVVSYDTTGALTLNSANIIIPSIEGYPLQVVAAFLNSKLFGFLFSRKFNTRKVLRRDLEKLPFPALSTRETERIIRLAGLAVKGHDVHEELDREIVDIFGLSPGQAETVLSMQKG